MFGVQRPLWKALLGILMLYLSLMYVELSTNEQVNITLPSVDEPFYPSLESTSADPTIQVERSNELKTNGSIQPANSTSIIQEPPSDVDKNPGSVDDADSPYSYNYYYNNNFEYGEYQDLGPIVLPNISSNQAQWKDILTNITSIVSRLCSRSFVCNASNEVGGGGQYNCIPCHVCYCDSSCHERGDCCLDKLLHDAQDRFIINTDALTKRGNKNGTQSDQSPKKYGCYDTFVKAIQVKRHYVFVDSCSEDFTDVDILNRCLETPSSTNTGLFQSERLQAVWPIWSNASHQFYRNEFCALCNGEDVTSLKEWDLSLQCMENVQLTSTNSMNMLIKQVLESEFCDLAFLTPTSCLQEFPISCEPPQDIYINTCNVTGRRETYDPLLWHGCHEPSFRNLFTVGNITYRNLFCALCNLDEEDNQLEGLCDSSDDTPFPLVLVMSASVLHQIPKSLGQDLGCRCRHDEMYDPYERKCRLLRCSVTRRLADKRCVPLVFSVRGVLYSFTIRLRPTNGRDIVWPSMSLFEHVSRDIVDCFQQKLDNISMYGGVIKESRIAARGVTFLSDLNNPVFGDNATNEDFLFKHHTVPVAVKSFTLKSIISLAGSIDDSSRNIEEKFLKMTQNIWKISADIEFRASLYYDDTEDSVTKYYKPTLLRSYDNALDYGLYISDILPGAGQENITHFYIPVKDTLMCAKVLVDLSGESSSAYSFDLDTGSLFHHMSGTTISFQHVEILQDGNVLVCADQIYDSLALDVVPEVPEDLFSASVLNVSIICQSLSVVSLFLVFFTYCLFPELRTLPGKNTLGLVTTLFLAMLLFEVGVARVEFPTLCVVLGILIHYLLLSSFTWMLVCSFHMYRIFTRLLRSYSQWTDKKTRTLVKYILIATTVPASIVGFTLLGNYLAHSDDCYLDLGYGVGICYLSNRWSLLLASALPISLMVLVNFGLFLRVMIALRSVSRRQQRFVRQQHQQLIVYIRMSTLTGINWLAGLAAASINRPVVWHVFSVLCGLQGLYVFVAFICNERVYRLYRSLLCGDQEESSTITTTATVRTADMATATEGKLFSISGCGESTKGENHRNERKKVTEEEAA